jgi:FixJ family two-component response regulator
MNPHLVSFVIPLKDEEQSLRELFTRIASEMDALRLDYEIIFVDDGSVDGSWRVVQELARKHPGTVAACRFRRNSGKAQALAAGFQAARGDVVFTLDADLQDDPKEIPRFLEKLKEGYDIVSGWKRKRFDPWHKVLPSRVFNKMLSKLVGVDLHDHNCGFKCYRAEVVKNVTLYGEMHRMIPSLASIKGYRSAEIEVEHHARVHGVSKYGVKRFLRGFMDMQTVYFLKNFRERPLHFMGGLAVALLLAGGLLDLASLVPGLSASLAQRMTSLAHVLLACPIPLAAVGFLAELLVHGIEEKGRRALIAEVIPGRDALGASSQRPMLSESGLRVLPPPTKAQLPAPAANAPRVLVVDDDPHMRDTLRLVLEEGGFAVEEAADTFSALSAVDEDTAVVLLDMNLPTQRDGLTCLKRLRKRDADLKIVMVSGQQEIQTAIETMKMGACDYVVKPFDAARLLRSVQRAVQMRRITDCEFEIEALSETERTERTAAAR